MDSSANEALVIGMNVFVFVIALSCAIMLMTTVLDMSEAANTIIKDTSGSSLLELYGDGEERLYTGYELLALSQKYNSTTTVATGGSTEFNTSGISNRYILYIQNKGGPENFLKISEIKDSNLNSKYSLEYVGEESGKMKYIFREM